MARIYTRTGDRGETGLFGGGRVSKSHPRVAAYGAVDELNAVIGVALSLLEDEAPASRPLVAVQSDLFDIGAHLATPSETAGQRPALPDLPDARIAQFEGWIDEAEAELAPLRSFILPGGTEAAAMLHMARTICRRAERQIVALAGSDDVPAPILVYLNRLSDYLFVAARQENHRAGREDVPWTPAKKRPGGRGD